MAERLDIVDRVSVYLLSRSDTYTLVHADLAELVARARGMDAREEKRVIGAVVSEVRPAMLEDLRARAWLRAAAASEREARAHAFWGRVVLWWLAFVVTVEINDLGRAFVAGLLGAGAP
ncbi:MAG: hypothetical protein ACLFTP_12855 [Rhodosalinus sp.]